MSDKELDLILNEIKKLHVRVEKAPSMNGEFTNLVEKIDKIYLQHEFTKKDVSLLTKSYETIEEKVDEIKDSIYDPEKGIFHKISEASQSIKNANDLVIINNKKLTEYLDTHKQLHDKIDKTIENLLKYESTIEDLEKWKSSMSKSIKATMVFFATSAAGLITKLIHDLITSGVLNSLN